jgi:PAS domain S-box-containing protein
VSRAFNDLAGLNADPDDFLAGVLEAVAQPVWVVDREGVIRFANAAATTALGYERAVELLGRPSHETIHYQRPDGRPCPADECPMLLPRTSGETVASDLDWFSRRDGSMFPVSYVSVPLQMRDGRGAVVAFNDIEERLSAERALREHEAALAAQQESLRRVATLVADGAPAADVFAAVAEEVGRVTRLPLVAVWRFEPDGATATVVGAWGERPHRFQPGTRWPLDGPTICAQVLETGSPARIDDFATLPGTIADAARETGIYACAGAAILVDGDVWGAMSADSTNREPLPDDIEDRLEDFTVLVAAAISTMASRGELARLADEQAALRRVATLVARDVPPPELFAAVARELALLLDVDAAHMGRFEPDGTATVLGAWSPEGEQVPIGTRIDLGGDSVAALVSRTGRPARIHDYEHASGPTAELSRKLGMRSSVGAPIIVDQRLWGVMNASTKQNRPLSADAESRIAAFTELVATAISNTEARTQMGRLADEQAALRRVATLVARGVAPREMFEAVTDEAGMLLGADRANIVRYDNETVTVLASWAAAGEPSEVGVRVAFDDSDLARRVFSTGRAARMDGPGDLPARLVAIRETLAIRSSVASPIVVEGRVWGALVVHSTQAEPLAADTESRLNQFTELVATATANAQARAEVQRLADEQAALRRVATLVARESPATEVFAAVAAEVCRVLRVEITRLYRYETDASATLVADAGDEDTRIVAVGTRVAMEGRNVAALVYRTGRAARLDDHKDATGLLGVGARELGVRCAVGTPIVVGDRLWGVIIVASRQPAPLPANTESRIAQFTELVATSISNVQARSDLAASRARIVAAADEERRRVVRDLHDGAQQRLVQTIVTLKLALAPHREPGPELVAEALDQAERANVELRELARGILPAALTQGGLRAGVDALASRTPVPVASDVPVGRLPAAVEATAYFVVAEALTNIAKHAHAGHAEVTARIDDGTLAVKVRDNGVGGARPDGSGLTGLADRLAALDGQLRVESPADGGTVVVADIPLPGPAT